MTVFGACQEYTCFNNVEINDIEDFPVVTIQVQVHFVKSNGNNFQCDNPSAPFYAPVYANQVLNRANDLFSDPPQSNQSISPKIPDTRIRYELYGSPSDPCESIFIHDNDPSPSTLIPDALHILVKDRPGDQSGVGAGQLIGQRILLYNIHWRVFFDGWTDVSNWAGLLNHEFGHLLGLCHSFSAQNECSDIDAVAECGGSSATLCNGNPCPTVGPDPTHPSCGGSNCFGCYCTWNVSNNFMSYGSQTAVTRTQWGQMFAVLMLEKPQFALFDVCNDPQTSTPLEISSQSIVHWDGPKYITQNVEVRSGSTLIISCNVWMAEGKRIIVNRGARLFVHGGNITSLSPDCKWNGILVHGNAVMEQPDVDDAKDLLVSIPANGAGVVWLHSAEISRSGTAISTRGSGSLSTNEFFGGLIIAEYSKFTGNGRAVEFMRYDKKNKSLIDNCIIRGEDGSPISSDQGISIWHCSDISITDTRFDDLEGYGIYGINYTAIIDGCVFEGSARAIESQSTFPNVTSSEMRIMNCEFDNNRFDIFIQSAPNIIYGYVIRNNIFYRGSTDFDRGIFISGEAQYTISKNYFDDKFVPVHLNSTGEFMSMAECNTFGPIRYRGIIARYNNRGMTFLRNDFTIPWITYVGIEGDQQNPGRIVQRVGNPVMSAGNCFAGTSTNKILASTFSSISFDYYVYTNPVPCHVPSNNLSDGGVNNYYLWPSQDSLNCGEPSLFFASDNDLANARMTSATTKAAYDADPGNLQKKNAWLDAVEYQNKVLRYLTKKAFEGDSLGKAESLMLGEQDKKYTRGVVGLRLQRGDVSGAQSLLNNIPVENQDDQWFRDIMQINFALEQNPDTCMITAQQETLLNTIANTEHSLMRGYACALLSLCKGYSCDDQMDGSGQMVQFDVNPSAIVPLHDDISVYPNPTNGELNIDIPTHLGEDLILRIVHSTGSIVQELGFENSGKLQIRSEFVSGIFFLLIFHDSEMIHIQRLAIVR